MQKLDQYRGCLIGGAAGDALGYAVEFLKTPAIFEKYGKQGITEYALVNGVAEISDDTQMTLFTANGILLGAARNIKCKIAHNYPFYIALCYKDWLKTQMSERRGYERPKYAWLNNVSAMNHSRDPGHTCIKYLLHDNFGSTSAPKNCSKG